MTGHKDLTGQEPVVTLPGEIEIDMARADRFADVYEACGVCVVRGLVAPEIVADLDIEARRLLSMVERGGIAAPCVARRPAVGGGDIFERIDPVCRFSPLLRAMSCAPELLRLAEIAVGGPAALFKDKLIFKLPGDAGYLLHQDFPYISEFEMPAGAVTTALIALDAMYAENGCLVVYAGYQEGTLAAPAGRPRDVAPEAVSLERRHDIIVKPGDTVFFHALAPHESGPNLTAATRRALFLTYTTREYAGMREVYYRQRLARRG